MARNNMNTKSALEKKQNSVPPKKYMQGLMKKMATEIAKALPTHIKNDRFQRMMLTAYNQNPRLWQCDPVSFIAAGMQSAQLGLEPNTPLGQAYLIPYGGKVQFQLGYKGLIELAHRSGQFKTIYAHAVHENDDFDLEYGLYQKLYHKPDLKSDRGAVIGFYSVYHLVNGGYSFIYMTLNEVTTHAQKFNQGYKKEGRFTGPWDTDFNAMAKKTALKQLLKYAPISVELQRHVSSDSTVKEEIKEDMSKVPSLQYDQDIEGVFVEPEGLNIDEETGEVLESE